MLEKIKLWITATGLKNLGWGAGFIVGLFLGWNFIAGACLGIFLHLNYTVIKELVNKIK
jgi:hypothetical protein